MHVNTLKVKFIVKAISTNEAVYLDWVVLFWDILDESQSIGYLCLTLWNFYPVSVTDFMAEILMNLVSVV